MREFAAEPEDGVRCKCVFCWDKPYRRTLELGNPALMDTPTLIAWIDKALAATETLGAQP